MKRNTLLKAVGKAAALAVLPLLAFMVLAGCSNSSGGGGGDDWSIHFDGYRNGSVQFSDNYYADLTVVYHDGPPDGGYSETNTGLEELGFTFKWYLNNNLLSSVTGGKLWVYKSTDPNSTPKQVVANGDRIKVVATLNGKSRSFEATIVITS